MDFRWHPGPAPDGPLIRRHNAFGNREILLAHLRVLEYQRCAAVMAPHLEGHQHAAGLPVNPVGELGDDVPLRVVQVAVPQVQRINKCIVPVRSDRMDHDARLLVEYNKNRILVQDVQGNLADAKGRLRRRRQGEADLVARLDAVRLAHARPGDADLPFLDQLLHLNA